MNNSSKTRSFRASFSKSVLPLIEGQTKTINKRKLTLQFEKCF